MSARASYWAARLSMEVLLGFRSWEPVDLFNPAPKAAESCYLWTFTTADKCDPIEVLRRWRGVARNWKGLRCFRVLEEHPGGHGWHLHFVCVERHDVRRVRRITTRHGFGRIHVKQLPAKMGFYAVKYLVKDLRKRTRRRLWACVGFQGVRANEIEVIDTFWQKVYSTPCPDGYSLGARRQLGLQRYYAEMFAREPGEETHEECLIRHGWRAPKVAN